MKKSILSMALAGLVAASGSAQAESLEQAAYRALAQHPQLVESFNEFRGRTEAYQGARGGYYPSIDLTGGIGFENEDSSSIDDPETLNRRELGLNLTQLIFDGFATSGEVARTENEAIASRYELINDAENMVLRVVEVYLEVMKQQDLVALAKRNIDLHKEIQRDIQRRTDSGMGSSADLTQIEGRTARSESNYLASRNNLVDAQDEYARVLGEFPMDLVLPVADLDMMPSSKDDATAQALANHPVLKGAEYDIAAADAAYKVSKSGYYPTVTLELEGNRYENYDGIEEEKQEVLAMLRVSYNLFNGGSDAAAVNESAYGINQAKSIKEDAIRQLEEGTRLAWNAWDILKKQKSFLQQHVQSSADTVRVYRQQFDIGQRTLLDVLNTEDELFEAQQDYITADIDELAAKYRLLNASGTLLAGMRISIPEDWK